jgi:hypothetical protein
MTPHRMQQIRSGLRNFYAITIKFKNQWLKCIPFNCLQFALQFATRARPGYALFR